MPPTVFISYSHADEVWKDRLVKQLGVLQQQNLLRTWDDRNIRAGDEWAEEIRKGMDGARIAVLLISSDSLTSNFILHNEVPHLLEKRSVAGLTVFPVICSDCLWQEVPWLTELQARPRDGKPLDSFRGSRLNTELAKIAKEILEIARDDQRPPKLDTLTGTGSEPINVPTGTVLSSLHQLPSPPADFTGREEELAVLRSRLTKGGTGAIFGLRGMGGIGKTALALKLAEELTPAYPDAQLYLDLKGVDPQPLTATQAMAHVVRSFHPEARLPESETDFGGLYRSVLHGKRVLLLMDNAAQKGQEQVGPLIPPFGSLLLVTSRFHFTLPGLFARNLDEMSAEDARVLLLTISPRIDKDADTIAHFCGRLPLALRLAGSALAERPDLSPTDYARRLKEGKERLGPVEASLSLSYELLSEHQRRLWRLLAVFPGTFDSPAASAVWELETDPASEALGELVRSSLVEWEEKEERYRLHDLGRSYADRQLDKNEHEAAQRRHAEHFLELLWGADRLYKEGGESLGHALRLFDAEWGNIQAGFVWASVGFAENEAAAWICDSYPHAGKFFLALRQDPREQIHWLELALAAAKHRKSAASKIWHLGNLGLAYSSLGNPRRAIECDEQALAIAREIGDRRAEGMALGDLGNAYRNLGDLHRATELFEQALAIAREVGDRRNEGSALGRLGVAYIELGKAELAIKVLEQRLDFAREIGDRRGEGSAFCNLSIVYRNREPKRAIEFSIQGLGIAREIGDRRLEADALGVLGNIHIDLGKPQPAIELYEQSLALAREIGDRRGVADASWNLGDEIEKQGDLARAADLMQARVDYLRELGHPDAEKAAAYVAALRTRIAEEGS